MQWKGKEMTGTKRSTHLVMHVWKYMPGRIPLTRKKKKGKTKIKKGYMTIPLGYIISSQLGAAELLTRKFDKQMWYY
jgi:hypothetical protein